MPHCCMYHPLAATSPPVRQVTEDEAEIKRILGEYVKKNVQNTVHIVFLVAAMTYAQCFVLCFREERPRAVNALYFGWPAFRNRHFII